MKKIIHLSDIHVGYADLGLKFNMLATRMCALKQPASDYVIVITGDIVDNAYNAYSESNNYEALDVIKKLESAGYTVLVVPGNHDYGSGSWGNNKFVEQFKQIYYGRSVQYPKLDIIDSVAFIGLDSIAEELHWYDKMFADGALGDDQIGRLSNLLSTPEVQNCSKRVVYLHHHPFDPKGGIFHCLKDSEKLKSVIYGRIEALLYGHNHDGKISNGFWQIPRCYDGGSATHKDNNSGYHRVIDLEKDPRWDYDGNFL